MLTKNGGTVFSAVLGSIRIVNLRVAEPTQTPASGVLHTLCSPRLKANSRMVAVGEREREVVPVELRYPVE